jgi:AcrR family transcriptional regulator
VAGTTRARRTDPRPSPAAPVAASDAGTSDASASDASASEANAGRRIRGLDAGERREQRRVQLLDAALDLFAARGYAGTAIEQICQTAYVGTKSFYELFDSKEACYLALLGQLADGVMVRMRQALAAAPDDEATGTDDLIATFARALVDDPRVARVTFEVSGGISPAVEEQRRANRRWAAGFVQSVWSRYQVTADVPRNRRPQVASVAVGVVGGLFDLVADWLHDTDPEHADVDALVADLSAFYCAARLGLTAR